MDRSLKKAAGSRQQAAEIDGGRITNAMPNAQCPMPNAQCPMPNIPLISFAKC
ncbi:MULTISPECIES: hypothetical protein [unclassified Nostoc]|uniref:hypothetical protein n=1 Tax=unclassified Nostoc TaxID=2593658 RepID=UPI0026383739|nr:hypothetical protein [Nostoc sp. S13]MDF5738115.1 hypothetical protein [Nostoc sp. S13]